ncbi:SUN domain-containing protein 3-like [Periplaneta americana]|uniref:SUN domain-containing protein 3-like n=1 Tax=Periplaneta americana TaxID=6978 RepID=UPI0037E9323E
MIHIMAVTLEHISHTISIMGNINSAPQQFQVNGFVAGTITKICLGIFTYDKNGASRQTFTVKPKAETFEAVELTILSNHGNTEYTCIYRFRVHGRLPSGTPYL